MKTNIKTGLLLTLILAFFSIGINAQTAKTKVIVTLMNGEVVTYNLMGNDYLTFNDGQNLIVNLTGSTETIALGTIRKVVFEKIQDGIEETASGIEIIPNPANDSFRVLNVEKEEDMTIYTLTGQKVMVGTISSEQTIDISHLANGLYLVKIGSRNLKLMKR